MTDGSKALPYVDADLGILKVYQIILDLCFHIPSETNEYQIDPNRASFLQCVCFKVIENTLFTFQIIPYSAKRLLVQMNANRSGAVLTFSPATRLQLAGASVIGRSTKMAFRHGWIQNPRLAHIIYQTHPRVQLDTRVNLKTS